jgi:hypothetical protein
MRPALERLPAFNSRPHTPLEVAYEQYRLERQGDRLSPATLDHYVCGLAVAGLFLAWPPPKIYWLGFPKWLPDRWSSNPVLLGSA